jgi:hypothetical protein
MAREDGGGDPCLFQGIASGAGDAARILFEG